METVQKFFLQVTHKEVSVSKGHTRTHSSSMELDETIVIEFEINSKLNDCYRIRNSPTYPKKLHAAMMTVAVPVSSSLMAHHPILSTILVNKEKSYKIYPAIPIIWFT